MADSTGDVPGLMDSPRPEKPMTAEDTVRRIHALYNEDFGMALSVFKLAMEEAYQTGRNHEFERTLKTNSEIYDTAYLDGQVAMRERAATIAHEASKDKYKDQFRQHEARKIEAHVRALHPHAPGEGK